MNAHDEARRGVRTLLALQICTVIAGVALLERMSPAVERILQANVYSTEAAEDMLAVLALGGQPEVFLAALARAKGNITEPEEIPLVDQLAQHGLSALQGNEPAMEASVSALGALAEVNRESMRQADASARFLGLAGAWAMAMVGFLTVLVSLIVSRRLESQLLAPMAEIESTLAAARSGDTQRRCSSPEEQKNSALPANVNWLLDQRRAPSEPREDPILREFLLLQIDQTGRQVIVGDSEGRVVAVNRAVHQGDTTQDQWTALALRFAAGDVDADWTLKVLPSGGWIATGG